MLIKRLIIEDIGCFGKGSPPFDLQEGINVIVGDIGTGKTTIIDAIGQALQDDPKSTQEDMVRHGESHGRIRVDLVTEMDGGEYTVERYVKREGVSTVEDRDLRCGEVLDRIRGHMNIPMYIDLGELWRQSNGISLEKIREGLVKDPDTHGDHFDGLPEVDTYFRTWKGMVDVTKVLEEESDDMEKMIFMETERVEELKEELYKKEISYRYAKMDLKVIKRKIKIYESNLCRSEVYTKILDDLDTSLKEIKEELRDTSSFMGSHEPLHTIAAGLKNEITDRLTCLKAQEHHTEKELEELRMKMTHIRAELQSSLCNLQDMEKEFAEVRDDLEFARFISVMYEKICIKVKDMIIEDLLTEVKKIYGELTGDQRMIDLLWDEEDGVVVYPQDEKRCIPFRDLAAGEQTCVALLVKLAVLKRLNRMDILFLDDPGSDLDGKMRKDLMDLLSNLKCSSQIVVITNDETFEDLTENVIRLERVAGETRVVHRDIQAV